jgi:predicted TIM-barrel fold metal-dependent hydrolase
MNPRSLRRKVSLALVALLAFPVIPACSHQTCMAPGPLHAQIKEDLRSLAQQPEPSIVSTTPVVDIHVHTFNARYLPLRGVLLGKRDAGAPFTWLISDHCAKVIAADLASRTELASYRRSDGERREMGASGPTTGQVSVACGIFSKLIDKGIQKGVWDGAKSIDQQMQALDRMADELSMSERLAVRATADMMGMDEHLEKQTPGIHEEGEELDTIKTFLRYLWTLTQSDGRIIDLYRHFHRNTTRAGEIRVVSHMMDLAPVYDQAPDGSQLIDYVSEQIPRTRAFTQQRTTGATYFVAYNPYRNHWQGGKQGDAFEIVKNAVRRQGAAGIKVYPPSGYRAAGNAPRKRPWTLATKFPGTQWDARYGPYDGDNAGPALDAEIATLLNWCNANKVPVFTHCGHGEFEARKGYGVYHADPTYWKQYLETHPEKDGSPCRLKLCLGHAGGGDYWYGCGEHADWGKTVYELCTTYPNVYCEITTGNEVLNDDRRAYFVEKVSGLIAESKSRKGCYDFGKKILHGTDWPQPDAGNPAHVLRRSQLAFRHPSLRPYYADYFHRNAVRYLGREL